MAQTTTNYGLLKPEATDSYNHLIYDNPNMDTIDAAMKANADAAITSATCIKSGTTHTITRSNTGANVMRFTATGDWNTGDTMIIDGVTVSPFLPTGEALKTGAYLINTEVLLSISGTRATVYSNQSEASTTVFDDSNVSFTANNVQDAIDNIETEINDLQIIYNASNTTLIKKGNVYMLRFEGMSPSNFVGVSDAIKGYFPSNMTALVYTINVGVKYLATIRLQEGIGMAADVIGSYGSAPVDYLNVTHQLYGSVVWIK